MAQMIPESLTHLPDVTSGEAGIFRLCQQKLDDDSYVWFNIPIRGRHADFVILNAQLGLLILEVKDWQLDQIRSMSPTEVLIETANGSKRVAHPLQQARNY